MESRDRGAFSCPQEAQSANCMWLALDSHIKTNKFWLESLFLLHHKTYSFIFTLTFPALVHLWVVLEGKVKGRLRTNR